MQYANIHNSPEKVIFAWIHDFHLVMRKILWTLSIVLLFCLASCNKKVIEDLQTRLDRLERTTIVSINSQISSARQSITSLEETQKLLREQIAALEAKGVSLSDIVEALKAKDDQFSSELTALKAYVEQNADDVKQWMEQAAVALNSIISLESDLKGIQDYLKSVESRLNEFKDSMDKLSSSLQKCQTELQEIRQSLKALQDDMETVKDQIEALVSSVQSIVVVPDHSDGSVDFSNKPDNIIFFEVYPLAAAKLLAQLGASAVSFDAVETKADGKESLNLSVSATAFDGTYFSITADGSSLPEAVKQGDVALSARLRISDGTVTRSSEYFPLWVTIDPTREEFTYVAEAVDLGLSVKWSAFNLGADTPEGFGAVFAWGETEVKQVFNWSTYKWCEGVENTINKYCTSEQFGTPDDRTVLEPEDDPAHVKLGGDWRMPTQEEMAELLTSCQWTWIADYNGTGIPGFRVTSLMEGFEDQSIFLPAAGYTSHVGPQYAKYNGSYWSATLSNPINPVFIYCVGFDFLGASEGGGYRFHGRSIRPVTK